MGLDFLIDNKFVVDPAAGTITDKVTGKSVDLPTAPLTKVMHTSVNLIIVDVYGELLSQFPAITAERSPVKPKYNIVHRIPTKGGPVYCKPRRVSQEAFTAVKATFEKLLKDGVISRSTSSLCSPFHLVAKKDSSLHPVGDFRLLNNLTDRDTYPLPHIHSFADHLHGMKLFSKVDLKHFYKSLSIPQI